MAQQEYPSELPVDSQLFRAVAGLEQQLLSASLRGNRKLLGEILHENFFEIGASGRTYDRDQVMELLATEDPSAERLRVSEPLAIRLSENLIQLRWKASGHRPALRSSLWFREQGKWQMLFHQGTLTGHGASKPAGPGSVRATGVAEEFSVRQLSALDAGSVYEAFISHPDMRRQGDADTPAKAQAYVDALLNGEQSQFPLSITANDRLIGLVCGTLDHSNANAWIWYWMHKEYRGRSLTTRAVATLANYLFDDLDFYRLELGLRANNPGSRSVAENNGFLREGTEQGKFLVDGERIDVYTYARLRTDPPGAVAPLPLRLA